MAQITTGIRAIFSRPLVYDVFQTLMGAAATRRELVARFIRPASGARVLDLGCGTAEILPCLPPSVQYWGFDMSPEYIAAARKRHGERGYFECGEMDQVRLAELPRFDVVLLLGVLHHLDDGVARDALCLARDALAPGGRVITLDPCLADDQNPIARCLVRADRGQNVRDPQGYRSLAAACFSQLAGTLRHRRWIPYTHWIMECHA